jgi:hypothetical protein
MICRSRGVLTFLTDIGHETNLKSKSEPCTPELPDSIPELQRQVIVFRISAAAHEAIRICRTALLTTSYPFSSSHFTIPSISFHHLNMPSASRREELTDTACVQTTTVRKADLQNQSSAHCSHNCAPKLQVKLSSFLTAGSYDSIKLTLSFAIFASFKCFSCKV